MRTAARRCSVVVPPMTAIFLPARSPKRCDVGVAPHQQAAGVDEDQRGEVHGLHPSQRRRRVAALDVGLALRDHREALGRGADLPVDLEVGIADRAADRRRSPSCTGRSSSRRAGCSLPTNENGMRVAREGDVDGLGGLDAAERVGGRLGGGRQRQAGEGGESGNEDGDLHGDGDRARVDARDWRGRDGSPNPARARGSSSARRAPGSSRGRVLDCDGFLAASSTTPACAPSRDAPLRPARLAVLGRFALLALLGALPAVAAASATLDRIKSTGTMRLAYREAAPAVLVQGSATARARLLGRAVRARRRRARARASRCRASTCAGAAWTPANRLDVVAKGDVDIECGTTTITLGRMEQVDFSVPIFVDGGSVLVRADANLGRLADLKGRRIAVIAGDDHRARAAQRISARANAQAVMVPVKDIAEGLAALAAGTVDGVAGDRIVLAVQRARLANAGVAMRSSPTISRTSRMRWSCARDDPDFRLAVNRALVALYRSGEIDAIFQRWFGALRRSRARCCTRCSTSSSSRTDAMRAAVPAARRSSLALARRRAEAGALRQLRARRDDPHRDASRRSGRRSAPWRLGRRPAESGQGHHQITTSPPATWCCSAPPAARGTRSRPQRLRAAALGSDGQDGRRATSAC